MVNGTIPPSPNGHWRINKDIPVSVIGFLIVQTLTFTWFLAAQYSTLSAVVAAASKAEVSAYTKDDAHRERELMDQRFRNQADKVDELTRRVQINEGRISEGLRK